MSDLILTILFGGMGYWKFKNRKILLGIIWFCTFGAFGIGWIYDIVSAYKVFAKPKNKISAAPQSPLAPTSTPVPLPVPQPVQQRSTATAPIVQSAISSRWVEADPVGEISRANIGKPAGPLGCYLTYTPAVLEPPTEKQLAYLKDLGVSVPDGATKQDASCMISRATGEDSKEGPSPELVALALSLGTKFSAYIGADHLLFSIVGSASSRDRAALYAYAVQQSLAGSPFGNMLTDPSSDRFYDFADVVLADASLVKSLEGREPHDYLKPQRGTKIYKTAVAFLEGSAP